jgi:hypothetical protein
VQAANTSAAPAAAPRELPNTAAMTPAASRLTPVAVVGLGLVVVAARLARRRRSAWPPRL